MLAAPEEPWEAAWERLRVFCWVVAGSVGATSSHWGQRCSLPCPVETGFMRDPQVLQNSIAQGTRSKARIKVAQGGQRTYRMANHTKLTGANPLPRPER